MNFNDFLALFAGILVLILLILVNFKLFSSSRKTVSKILLCLLALLLALPFWYLIQFIIAFTLANTVPQSKIVDCVYLNEENCKKRSDCTLSYPIGGLAKELKPICIYKSKSLEE